MGESPFASCKEYLPSDSEVKAWNIKPKSAGQAWRPSAEFVESALIFTYGSTNIFLEHLGNWGKEYSAQDLEHISITVLFLGGGLVSTLLAASAYEDV